MGWTRRNRSKPEQIGRRSLRDPEVQALLDRARPGWRWEPMLVEIEGEQVRVWAGLAMRARLVQVLGPVRALRLAQAVARMGGPVLGVDWGRRRFLGRALGALAGLLLIRHAGQAAAAPSPPPSGGLPIRRSRRLEGRERAQALERFRTHPDLWALGLTVPQEDGEFPLIIAHELADDNTLLAAGWVQKPNEVVVTYAFARPWSPEGKALRIESEALRIVVDPDRVWLAGRSVNGWVTAGTQAGAGTGVQPMSHCAGCNNCWTGPWETDCQSCASWNYTCLWNCCGWPCGTSCAMCVIRRDPLACAICVACIVVHCPLCASGCCLQWVHDCCACGPCPGP